MQSIRQPRYSKTEDPLFYHSTIATMKSTVLSLLFAFLCLSSALSFHVRPSVASAKAPSSTSLNVFGNKKSTAAKAEEDVSSKYWQGEWVCKDCGYIYNRVSASFYCYPILIERKKTNLKFDYSSFLVGSFLLKKTAARMCWYVF